MRQVVATVPLPPFQSLARVLVRPNQLISQEQHVRKATIWTLRCTTWEIEPTQITLQQVEDSTIEVSDNGYRLFHNLLCQ